MTFSDSRGVEPFMLGKDVIEPCAEGLIELLTRSGMENSCEVYARSSARYWAYNVIFQCNPLLLYFIRFNSFKYKSMAFCSFRSVFVRKILIMNTRQIHTSTEVTTYEMG